ncbi:MAG TPA: hypothetical protein VF334_10670, partial [Polyangia bacterium]
LAVAGAPVTWGVAAAAVGLGAAAYARATDELRAARLLRTAGSGLRAGLEPYHDEIRQAIVEPLPRDRRRALHRALADALARPGGAAEAALLFRHWLGAGDAARAARAAEQAGADADRQLAFELAADYYGRALALDGTDVARRRALLPRRARALANAGKKREAVAAYREAAAVATVEARTDHLRSAAEVLLRNGDIDEGVELLRAVLHDVGLRWPRGPRRALAALVAHRVRVRLRGLGFVERAEAEQPAATLARIDTAWSAAMALALVDRARGADFQAQGLLLALRAGEPYRVARAVILEAAYSCMGGSRSRARTRALVAEARRLAERCAHPHALALVAAVEGIAEAMAGDFRAGARRMEAAEPLLRAHASRWDRLDVEYLHLMTLTLLGELGEVERRVARLVDEARTTDDLSLLVNVRVGFPPLARLAHDDVADARRDAEEAMRRWSQRGFHRQHWSALFAAASFDLYEGKGEAAWQRLLRAWGPLRRALLLRSQPVRVAARFVRARAAVATGRTRQAARDAALLEQEGVGWATAFAALVRASLDPSPPAFERAAELCAAAGLALHAAVARRRAGVDDPYWRQQSVADPDGFVRCLAPGGRA